VKRLRLVGAPALPVGAAGSTSVRAKFSSNWPAIT